MMIQHKIRTAVKDAKVFMNPLLRRKLHSKDWKALMLSRATDSATFAAAARVIVNELLGEGWTFGYCDFNDGVLGECRLNTKELVLSRTFVEDCVRSRSIPLAVKAFLHEVAHGLEGKHFGTGGHGDRWSFFCDNIGIPGEKPNQVLDLFDARWSFETYLVHPDEGKVICGFWKRPEGDASEWVIDGRPETRGKLVFMTRNEIVCGIVDATARKVEEVRDAIDECRNRFN